VRVLGVRPEGVPGVKVPEEGGRRLFVASPIVRLVGGFCAGRGVWSGLVVRWCGGVRLSANQAGCVVEMQVPREAAAGLVLGR
jgi:hypothetical protein